MSSILGPAKGYVELLDEAILAQEEKDASKWAAFNPLRPSSAGECARKLAYRYEAYRGFAEYVSEKREPRVTRLLNLGHFIESHIIKEFRKVEGLSTKYMQQIVGLVEYEDGSRTEGSLDMAFQYNEFSGGVSDAKSKGDKFDAAFKTKWDKDAAAYAEMKSVTMVNDRFFWIPDLDAFLTELRDDFFRMNFYQLNVYVLSDFMRARNYDHASVIQYNKNDSRMREFRFAPSEKAYQAVKDKFTKIQANPDKPELIERERGLGSMSCSFCEHAKRCWPEVDTRQSFFDSLPPKKWPTNTSKLAGIGAELERKYESFKAATDMEALRKQVEEEMVTILREKEVDKIRFSDGKVYKLKFLKSPKPHYELRPSKA